VHDDEPMPPIPGRLVAVAFLLALVCLLVPLAIVGAVFAGIVLIRRGRPTAGAGVLVLGVVCATLGGLLQWT